MSQNEDFTVTIPKALVKKLRASIKNTNFTSITQYVISLIRKALAELEVTDAEKVHTKEEEEIIKKRLKSLGYID